MLKAFTPVAILLISALFKIQHLNQKLILIVCVSLVGDLKVLRLTTAQMISVGCATAAYGELDFELFGFLCQASAVAVSLALLVRFCPNADGPSLKLREQQS